MIEKLIEVAGETLALHQERALWRPAQRALLLADVHLGKGAVLRRAGVSVPSGQTAADLARLDQLIEHYQPLELIVLGDLVHGPSAVQAPWVDQVRQWRARHDTIAMQLIAGNHDRHFDARVLGFDVVAGEILRAPFVFRHAPAPSPHGYVLAGHVHPGITIRDGWRRHRLPAFRFRDDGGILPAFGSLTGIHEQLPTAGERIVAVTPAGLLDVQEHLQ